jgi:hypothetical protein
MEERRLAENSCCERSSCDQHIQGAGLDKRRASRTQQYMIFARAQGTQVHQCQENINELSTAHAQPHSIRWWPRVQLSRL